MKNWMRTKQFNAEVQRDKNYEAHVVAYYRNIADNVARQYELDHPITETYDSRGCNNSNRNWYECGFVSPTEARHPSFIEDPTLYILSGD